jgi:hypothetical protein
MKAVYRFMTGLHIFIGAGALVGGAVAILNPGEPFGMPTDFLVNSPFTNYLVPGIILFSAVGILNLVCGALIIFKYEYSGYITFITGWILVFWIVIQCIMINTIALPHVIYFFLGLTAVAFSVVAMFDKMLIPVNMAYYMYKCMKRCP